MIDGLRPYPEMRQTGLPWLGDVPAHWDVRRLKRCLVEPLRYGANAPAEGRNSEWPRYLRITDFTKDGRLRDSTFRSLLPDIARDYLVRPGDVLFARSGATAGKAFIVPSDIGLACHAGYLIKARVREETLNPKFLFYFSQSDSFSGWRNIEFIQSTIPNINAEKYANLTLPIPPLVEQRLIVRFLDWHGTQTAKLIRAKKKLIALLNEQKQAIIHRAVTGGLDPNVKFKPSGIPWLGDVPEGWEVRRLRSISRNVTSGSRGWSQYAADHGPLFVRIANLSRTGLHLRFDDVVRLALPATELGEAARTRTVAGDLLLSITAYIGSVAIVPDNVGDAYVSQHVACCRLIPDVNPRWIGYVLLSPIGQAHGTLSMNGGTKQGLSLDDVKNYVVLLPSREIQNQIANWIDVTTSQVSNSISSVESEISLIQEYRTRLIADVVTGKLDIRHAAANLPQIADLEPINEPIVDEDEGENLDEPIDAAETEEVAA